MYTILSFNCIFRENKSSLLFSKVKKDKENANNMLRVMNNHRKAAYDSNDYEGLSHDSIAIDQDLCPEDLLVAAQLSWDEAVELGTKNGYRKTLRGMIKDVLTSRDEYAVI